MRLGLGLRLSGTGGAADTTAPEITSLTAGTQTDGDVPISFDLDESATVFWVLVTNGASAPNVAEVVAGQASGGGSPADSGSFSATAGAGVTQDVTFTSGLSGAYDMYFVPRDAAGNTPAAVDVATNITIDSTAPGTTSYSPADNATDVATDADLVIVFNESMKTTGTAASVTLKNVGGATIETFDPDTDGTWSTTTNSNDTWTVTPTSAFTNEAALAVQYSGFEDVQGNVVAAVSNDTTWNFDVVAAGFTDPTSLGLKLIAWLDFTDTSTLWQTTAGSSGTAATSISDPVQYVDDKSGNGNDFSATAGNSPGNMLVISGGVDVNDAGFKINGTATGLTSGMECYALIELNGEVYSLLLGEDLNSSFGSGIFQDGSSSAVDAGTTGTITHTVDGVDQSSPTRGTLYNALDAAGPGYVVQGLRGIDLSGLTTTLMPLAYTGAIRFLGNARHFILTTPLTTSERADLDTWLDGEK